MTVDEIKEFVQAYGTAAFNAVNKAGFDGSVVHDICLISSSRTLPTSGQITVGAERTGIRFSPWGEFQDMRMEDPKPTFAYLVSQIKEKYPNLNLAYIHLIEPRVNGGSSSEAWLAEWSNDFIRDIWAPRPLISAGGYSRDLATEVADEKGDLIAFGRVLSRILISSATQALDSLRPSRVLASG
ncbi:hypothetical protein BDZ89DRAFT_1160457 [Hymenopellis radicata]|nr:hypothetical protein BDZ89DRAFT_1160457 [Hymenopellis radicata]